MNRNYTSIYLNGFRGAGKTTIGPVVAKRLGWEYVEMDQLLAKRAGRSIQEITKNGTYWQEFRQLEHALLKKLLQKERVVVSTGGGLGVNLVKNSNGELFGELNAKLMREKKGALIVVLSAEEEILSERIREMEEEKAQTVRPILDEKRARRVEMMLEQYKSDSKKQKEILVEEIIKDAMKIYAQRKLLYAQLSNVIIDTGRVNAEEAAEEIMTIVEKDYV